MKKPSDATALRQLRSDYNRLKADYDRACEQIREYRGRTTKAEQDSAEWKRRFDLLLSKCHMEVPL